MINVAVAGASGRMGRQLIAAAEADPASRCAAALLRPGHQSTGDDAGRLAGIGAIGVALSSDLAAALRRCDVLIDFTLPDALQRHLDGCVDAGKPLLIGTTGFDADAERRIRAAAERIALVLAPNTSVGVNVTLDLLRGAARAFGDDCDIEIIEAHHRHKADAPSGTARQMGETIAAELGRDLTDCAVYGRHGRGGERERRSIGFSAVRGGDIVGEHTVLFAGDGERLEITHRSSSRATFASGAVRAAKWLVGRPAGFYRMADVLGLGDRGDS